MKVETLKLQAFLQDIRRRVSIGDSFEGMIQYSCLEKGLEPGEWEVSGLWRIGNLDGQGGTRVLPPTVEGLQRAGDTLLRISSLSESEKHELLAFIASRAAFRDPGFNERICEGCGQPYRGPAVYCCHACALADGGFHA